MKTYVISQKPENLDWSKVPSLAIDTCLWNYAADVEAKAQLCYDENALYVRLSTREANIRAQETGPIGSPCLDSCLEFFFCPDPGNKTYFNVEFNPNGCLFLGIGNDRYDLIRLLPVKEDPLAAEPVRTEEGWAITYRIEAAFIRRFFPDFQLTSGGMMRGNFYKCGDETVTPHYYSWNPVTSETPDFHRSVDFGKLYLA